MKKGRSKRIAVLALALAACGSLALGLGGSASASTRTRVTFEENFMSDTLNEENWMLVDDDEAGGVRFGYGGDGGTLVLKDKSSWEFGAVYSKTPVTVADDEDLVIEYDLISGATSYFMGISKGLQEQDGKVVFTVDDRFETIYSFPSTASASAAGFSAAAGTTDDEINSSVKDQAAKDAILANKDASAGYGLDFSQGEVVTPRRGIAVKGYTYRHVFDSEGGYTLYTKPIGAEDSEYAATMRTVKKFPGTEIPVFSRRSGYIGFNFHGESGAGTVEIDNYSVKTSKAGVETVAVSENFDRTSTSDEYRAEEYWGFTKDGTAAAAYPAGSMIYDNPADDNYLYSVADKRIVNDGLYDEYFVFTAELQLASLTGGRTFGFVFGGETSADIVGKEGIYYLYFADGPDGVTLHLCTTVDGESAEIGEPVKTGIVLTGGLVDAVKISLRLTGRLDKSLDVEVTAGDSEPVAGSFADEEIPVVIQNRFGVLANGGEAGGGAVAALLGVKLQNTYNVLPEGPSKTVAENFNGVDEKGRPWINEEDLFILNKGAGSTMDSEEGIYVEDGQLRFVNGGHGGGLAVRYAYGNWKMTFDVTEMQREPVFSEDGDTVIRPVNNSPIILCFGMRAEGLGYTTGKAVIITSPLTKKLGDPGFNEAVGKLDQPTQIRGLSSVGGRMVFEKDARQNFLDPALDGYTIRFELNYRDGELTLAYCVLGLEDYRLLESPILKYTDVDGGGFLGITTTHDGAGNMAGTFTLDNFRAVDLDENGEIVTVDKPKTEGGGGGGTVDPAPTEGIKTWAVCLIAAGTLAAGAGGAVLSMYLFRRKKRG